MLPYGAVSCPKIGRSMLSEQDEVGGGERPGIGDAGRDLVASQRLQRAGTRTASPRITASMSVIIRRTPCAMTAMPPITIHGASSSESARRNAASASSIRDRLRARPAGMVLDASSPPPALVDRSLADRIARAGPVAHGFERAQRRQRMGNGTRRLRSLGHSECLLQSLGRSYACASHTMRSR